MPTYALARKVALITGAARGQGRAEVDLFHRSGALVIATDLDVSVADLPTGVEYVQLDVTSAPGWDAAVAHIRARHGHLDILINNAGYWQAKTIADTTGQDFDALYRVNQLAVLLGMNACSALMADSGGGSIVNIASGSAWSGSSLGGAYGATKWAVRGLSRSAVKELGANGIRVNTVMPGFIATTMTDSTPKEALDAIVAGTPLGRAGLASEVAEVVAFLASDAASFVSGAEIAVDGGAHA